jgi:hypothetical protein
MADALPTYRLDERSPEAYAAELSDALREGRLDPQGLERANRLSRESSRIDRVLSQLGLVSERQLAETTARLLDIPIAAPGDYPQAAILPERLKPGSADRG